ncbi:uncharacterized protein LOC116349218 isoform X2 [Contarinia nasturtii]|uniref:uncharacterized protein LOC116349218 isoform X2 n=1 Tax=Contarinia nasturtii TaxID=265458 RepID=UPI0012D45F9F|nr:uncharacterized protein LOC116349218 isoform X2 [Contarinia nasturtii]
MRFTIVPHSDSENDDANDDDSASQLLLQPSLPTSSTKTPNSLNCSTIKLPKSANQTKSDYQNRVLTKISHLANIKLHRIEYRRSHRDKWSRINIGIFTISFLSVVYFCVSMNLNVEKPSPQQIIVDVPPVDVNLNGPKVKDGYLVWSPNCQIPAIDPLAADVMKLFRREKYEACSTTQAVTRIEMNWTTSEAMLIYDYKPKWYSSFLESTCCYSEIIRTGSGKKADEQFKLSSCTKFNKSFLLPSALEFIFVKCESMGRTVYKNAHAIIRERSNIRKRLNNFKEKSKNNRPLSVLMLSIDSVSRLNLIRAMPKTAQHLYDTGWFELQGYNKIDDNTFPNLMAILTGYNQTLAYGECSPRQVGKLEECPLIWNEFKDSGYVTSYGEDEVSISSFNFNKKGFVKPPTDYYLRPYMLAAEKYLPIKKKHSLTFCLGNKHSADHIYDFAMDFGTHYKNDASFGLYWTNTFSHNDISDPSSMDNKMRSYLDTLEMRGILNESMVVFFSDHGLRFGPVRHLFTGWYEERLPFMFIWLPEWFRSEHPDIVHALKINRNRLTNPYDLHMTLKHVLQLSNPDHVYAPATSCLNCQSLFVEVPWNRSCDDVSIAAHWCTCTPYHWHNKNDKIVKDAVKFVINNINQSLKNYTHDDRKQALCAELKLKKVSDVHKAEFHDGNDHYDDYLLKFEVAPSDGWFESTVRHRPDINEFEVTGTVSRLDSYGSQGNCIKVDYLRKYCFCTGISNPKNKKG